MSGRLAQSVGVACLLAASACFAETPATPQEAIVGTTVLTIAPSTGVCVVADQDGKRFETGLTGPCFFARANDRLLSYTYPQFDAEAIVAVVGDPIGADVRTAYGLSADRECGSSLQGLIVRGGAVADVSKPSSGGVYCRDTLVDEKNFFGLAESAFGER